jgi:CubicO group peptidase (beta-lactamase class C family)
MESRIFEPLGMVDTGFYVPDDKHDRLAALYIYSEEDDAKGLKLYNGWHSFKKRPNFLEGGGGQVTTFPDFFRFARFLFNRGELDGVRLLKRETVNLMTSNQVPDALMPIQLGSVPANGLGFGLGVFVITDASQIGNMGSNGRFNHGGISCTLYSVDPTLELIAIIMSQLWIPDGHPMMFEFMQHAFKALLD